MNAKTKAQNFPKFRGATNSKRHGCVGVDSQDNIRAVTKNQIDCRNPNEIYVGELTNWRVQRLNLHPTR